MSHLNTSSIMVTVRRPPKTPPRRFKGAGLNDVPTANVYDLYPPPLTSDVPIPQRVNPVYPDPPERRTTSMETRQPNWQNNFRSDVMARREYHRYHTAWSRYYYGNPSEQEIYKRNIREGLKQQMQEIDAKKRTQLHSKVRESEVAVERDREDLRIDKDSVSKRKLYMTQFRDANKNMMENAETRRRENTSEDHVREQEMLRYNPINWSHSLK